MILISFVSSFIAIIGLISLSPYIQTFFSSKRLVYGIQGQFDYNSIPDDIVSKISNGLLDIDSKGNVVPLLINSWEVKNNGKQYRLYLRNDLYWSDGKKLVASDINYQFKNITVKTEGDYIIDFYLDKPLPIFLTYLRKPLLRYPLVGVAGLYKTAQIKTKYGYISELDLEPNKPNLSPITYKFYNNESQLITAYKKGEVNSITGNKKSVADTFSTWKNTSVKRMVDYSRLMTLFFNFSNPLLKEKEVRDAFDLSINTQVLSSYGELAIGPIQPVSWAYNPDLKRPTYDTELASKIIKKDTTSSESAKFNLVTSYEYYDIADALKKDFDQVGINVNIQMVSFEQSPSFDLFLAYWKVPSDPDQYFFWHSTQVQGNIGGYKNVKIDKLLEDGRNTLNIDDRIKIYYEFQRVMLDDPPALFLFYPYVYTITRK